LSELLSEVRPAQIDETETALTAERDVLIVLLPHRTLGGISIVVWLTDKHGGVVLAQVGGLGLNHDSLDLGVGVAVMELDRSRPNFAPLLARVRQQLFNPLTVRLYGENQATVWVRDGRDVLRRVGAIGEPPGWFERTFRRPPPDEVEIRFVDSELPPVTEASGVNEWFTTSDSA